MRSLWNIAWNLGGVALIVLAFPLVILLIGIPIALVVRALVALVGLVNGLGS